MAYSEIGGEDILVFHIYACNTQSPKKCPTLEGSAIFHKDKEKSEIAWISKLYNLSWDWKSLFEMHDIQKVD